MSVAKVVSRAVGKVRKRLSKRHSINMTGSTILLGAIDPRNELGVSLHHAAMMTKSKLKKLLHKGISIPIDYPNSLGQTPLLCACAVCNEDTARLLLQYAADPNVQDKNGVTSVHVVCSTGNTALLCHMIKAGGDVSLKDKRGHGVMEWASKNDNAHSRNLMLAFLQTIHSGVNMDGDEGHDDIVNSKNKISRNLTNTSVLKLGQKATGSDVSLTRHKRAGYGQVYPCARESSAIVSVVPLISDTMLKNQDKDSYCCSLDFIMTEMLWHVTEVSVKTIKSGCGGKEANSTMMSEASFLSKLRHPNVITLMALCQPPAVDRMALVFERVHKNLYHYLHTDDVTFPPDLCVTLAIQTCSGIAYIHDQGFIHCALSSHAVYLTYNVSVKLGNLEFMVDSSQTSKGHQSRVTSHKNVHKLYPWMAPEIVSGSCSPLFTSDLFSFACLLWEMFTCNIPWSDMSEQALYQAAISEEGPPALSMEGVPQEIHDIIDMATRRHHQRHLNFVDVYTCLSDIKQRYRLNRSHNSITKDAPLTSPRQSSPERKKISEDKLVFPTRSLHTQGRSYQSTSAIATVIDNKNGHGSGYTKNCSEGDLQACLAPASQTTSPVGQWAIKPASHHQQQELHQSPPGVVSKTLTAVAKDRNDCMHYRSREESYLKHTPCTVRQLAEDYQQIIVQHKLRQEILKGSMAPRGGCDGTYSPMDSPRWHSLPSTIRELSKTWSPDEETAKTACLSDLANLSCTPQVKQTSTPLRRGLDERSSAGSLGLRDFFLRQRKPRNIQACCNTDTKTEMQSEYMDKSTEQRAANVLEEMRLVQSHWKRRVTVEEEEEESIMGVSYHSPVIRVKKKTSLLTDHMDHTLLQTGDDCDDTCQLSHSPHPSVKSDHYCVHQPNKSSHVEDKQIDDPLANCCGNLQEKTVSPTRTRTEVPCELNESIMSAADYDKDTACLDTDGGGGKEGLFGSKSMEKDVVGSPVKDSFWDVTTQWSKVNDNTDGGCRQGCEGSEQQAWTVGRSIGEEGEEDEVKQQVEAGNVSNERQIDATFSVQEDGCDCQGKKDLNGTFVVDADVTEPDSWFPDGPVSHVSSQMEDPRIKGQELTEIEHGDEAGPQHSRVVEEGVKTLGEFEIQEFYIDDELDTSESIQPESVQLNDSLDTSGSSEEGQGPLQPLTTPSSTHVPDPFQNPLDDKLNDNDQEASQNLSEYMSHPDVKKCPLSEQVSHPDVKECLLFEHIPHPDVNICPLPEHTLHPDVKECPLSEHVPNPDVEKSPLSEHIPKSIGKKRPTSEHLDKSDKSEQAPNFFCQECPVAEQVPNIVNTQNILQSLSPTGHIEEETICDVRDKIALFEGSGKDNDGIFCHFQQLFSFVEKHNSSFCQQENQGRSFNVANEIPVNVCGGDNVRKNSMEGRGSDTSVGKSRLIPKIRGEELKPNMNRLCLTGHLEGGFDIDCSHASRGEDSQQSKIESHTTNKVCEKEAEAKFESYCMDDLCCSNDDNLIDGRQGDNKNGNDVVPNKKGVGNVYDDSYDWVSERLRSVQEKICRRRQRDVYTISSEEDEEEEEGLALTLSDETWRTERGQAFDMWEDDTEFKSNILFPNNFRYDDTSSCHEDKYKAVSMSSSERLSLPHNPARSSFSKWSFINKDYLPPNSHNLLGDGCDDFHQSGPPVDSRGEESSTNEYRRQKSLDLYRMNRALSSGNFPNNTKKPVIKRRSNSQRSRYRSMDNVHSKVSERSQNSKSSRTTKSVMNNDVATKDVHHMPTPRPRSIGNVCSNESRSTVRTVMFEDETDGLKQFSPTAMSREFVSDDIGVVTCCDVMKKEDTCDASPHYGSRGGNECSRLLASHGRLNETFDVKRETANDDALTYRHRVDERGFIAHGRDVVDEVGSGEGVKDSGEMAKQHCLTLGLQHDQDNPEVHRFYIPKSEWPNGFKARYHVAMDPNHPYRHRISTTTIDPVSGRTQVLMDKTLDIYSLKSHFRID